MWRALRHAAQNEAWLAGIDFDGLIKRAERQREELEPFRLEAALEAAADQRP